MKIALLSADVLPWLADVCLQSTLLMALAGLVALASPRLAAARRYTLLSLALFAIPLVMLITLVLPDWRLIQATPPHRAEIINVSTPDSAVAEKQNVTPVNVATTESAVEATQVAPKSWSFDLRAVAAPVWLGGVSLGLLVMLASVIRLSALRRHSDEAPARCLEAWQRVAAESGIRDEVQLRSSEETGMPMTWGWFQPLVLLPSSAEHWPEQHRLSVLRHEAAHIARADTLLAPLLVFSALLLWFHPLAWILLRSISRAREAASDDRALQYSKQPAGAFATDLLQVVAGCVRSQRLRLLPLSLAMATADKQALQARLTSLLDENRARQPWSKRSMAALMTCALLMVILATGLSACRESKESKDDLRLYMLTDAQWESLNPNREKSKATTLPMDPFAAATGTTSQVKTPEVSLADVALTIRSRLLAEGIVLNTHPDVEALTLKDRRTLLIRADEANQNKIASFLAKLTHEEMIFVTSKFFSIPKSSKAIEEFGLSFGSAQTPSILGIQSPAKVEALLKRIKESKEIKLLSAPSVTMKNNQRATVEVARELLYPTKFDPPQVPKIADGKAIKLSPGTGIPVTPATSTAFEMRPVGIRLDLEGKLKGRDLIELEMVPEVTEFTGFINYGSPIKANTMDPDGRIAEVTLTENRIPQAVFRSAKVTTSVLMKEGDYVILGGLEFKQDTKKQDPSVSIQIKTLNELDLTQSDIDELVFFIIQAQIKR